MANRALGIITPSIIEGLIVSCRTTLYSADPIPLGERNLGQRLGLIATRVRAPQLPADSSGATRVGRRHGKGGTPPPLERRGRRPSIGGEKLSFQKLAGTICGVGFSARHSGRLGEAGVFGKLARTICCVGSLKIHLGRLREDGDSSSAGRGLRLRGFSQHLVPLSFESKRTTTSRPVDEALWHESKFALNPSEGIIGILLFVVRRFL